MEKKVTTEWLIETLTKLRREIDGPVTHVESKLMCKLLGQIIETFRLQRQYHNLRRSGNCLKMDFFEPEKDFLLSENDLTNLAEANKLHKAIVKRLSSRKEKPKPL